ncbi:hypothetical protein ACFLZM_07280, partial [Thermodesulfobacteriota bacterium]
MNWNYLAFKRFFNQQSQINNRKSYIKPYLDKTKKDGEKYLRGEVFLVIRKSKEGRWAIHEISTILKPADRADSLDTEAIEESRRILTLYMYTYETRDQKLLKQLGWPYEEGNQGRISDYNILPSISLC